MDPHPMSGVQGQGGPVRTWGPRWAGKGGFQAPMAQVAALLTPLLPNLRNAVTHDLGLSWVSRDEGVPVICPGMEREGLSFSTCF